MHHLAHLVRRQEQVVAAVLGLQEAEAVRVGDDAARDEVQSLSRREAAAAVQQQLAVAHHRGEPLRQGFETVGRLERERLGQFVGGHRAGCGDEVREDGLAAGDRVVVALRLAARMGVAELRWSGATWRGRLVRRGNT